MFLLFCIIIIINSGIIGILFPLFVSSSITLHVNEYTYGYPTYNPFAVKMDHYNVSGILVTPQFTELNQCTLKSNSTDNDYSIAALLNQSSRIVLVEEQDATRAGCKTVAQISEAVKAYSQTEYEMKQPPIRAVLYVLRGGSKEASGGPLNRNYFSYAPDAVDGTPIIPVTILPSIYSDELLSLLASLKFPPIANVNEGSWNTAIFSTGYSIADWTLFSINLIILLYGMGQLITSIFANQLFAKKRIIIFIIALISVILFTVTFLLNPTTRTYRAVISLSSYLFSVAFHLLLSAWYSIQAAVDLKQRTIVLKSTIFICCILQSTVYAIQFIRCFVTPTSFFQQLNLIDEWVIVIVQSVSIIVFFYYGILFSIQGKRQRKYSPASLALHQLSHMAFSCCLCFVFVAVYNATVTFLEWSSNIPMVIGMMLLLNIGNTIRSFVLLCVLGLRIPGLQTEQPTILLAALRHVTRKLRSYKQQETRIISRPSIMIYCPQNPQLSDTLPEANDNEWNTCPSSFLHSNYNVHYQDRVHNV